MIRVAIGGVRGRMGGALLRVIAASDALELVAAVDRPGGPAVGQTVAVRAGEVRVVGEVAEALAALPQVWIDFTTPEASVATARACSQQRLPMVIGTTGFGQADRDALTRAATAAPMVLAPNMSVGMNAVVEAVKVLARALGPGLDAEIVELHHGMKKDAPSGTALRLAEELASARGGGAPVFGRHGAVGARSPGEIGVHALRGGDSAGEHTVFFLGKGERVELSHRVTDRDTFASGALRAAAWVVGRPPGLYGMSHVLGLA